MNKKQPETTKLTRQNIKDAFWALYIEKKIDKITVKDITTKAGYNRSTFYTYFKDVYDVLEQIEADIMPDERHLPPIEIDSSDMSTINSPNMVAEFIDMYERNSQYYSVLLSEKGDPAFAVKMKKLFKAMMVNSIKEQMDISMIELDYALEFIVGATISVIQHWFDQDKNISLEDLTPMIYQLMDNEYVRRLRMMLS